MGVAALHERVFENVVRGLIKMILGLDRLMGRVLSLLVTLSSTVAASKSALVPALRYEKSLKRVRLMIKGLVVD